MSKTIGRFGHEVTKMTKDDRLPFDPYVMLCLQSYGGTTRDRAPTISAHLMSEDEIDSYVSQLKADLDTAGASAKRALKAAKEQTQRIVSERGAK
ncbi:hypothetical protein HLB44_36500 [Aquincola sp. S2]|uniref:Uncharacterized protein n=1 Tax=Pseudaquabacterium terrae TaxID=2732868 RepID=A0ABX2EUP7_9BURK|nr:hypothetical protein [Aquabacterium terrae]NRF72465.1 hypothetical protein [Aquabacterium terrae]